jgi:dethiobiotin synthetase
VEAAAALEGAAVTLDDFQLPATEYPLVVEGAGGVLVPLAPGVLMIDLMARLGLPVVLVARTTLGTINHTLLSLAALRARGLTVAGVVLVGRPIARQPRRDRAARRRADPARNPTPEPLDPGRHRRRGQGTRRAAATGVGA